MGDKKKTILVVDDEVDIRTSIKSLLVREGYDVITAVSCDDALEKVRIGKKPDLILMDIMMPGIPATVAIPKLAPIKVAYLSVLRTSKAEKKDFMKFKNVRDFIHKPFDVEELVRRVKKLTA